MSQSLEQEVNELRSMLAAFISGQTPNAAQIQAFVRAEAAKDAAAKADADAERQRSARAKLAEADEMIALGKAQRTEALVELGLADADADAEEEEPITEPRRKKGAVRPVPDARMGDEKRARIRGLVDKSRGLFIEEIADATGYTKSAVWTHVSKLESLGYVWTEQNVHNPKTGRSTGTKVYPRSMMRKRRR